MNEIGAYIATFPPDVQQRLSAIRGIVREEAPQATERICMKMPTFDLNGKWFVHFAAFPKHIGFYPQPEGIAAFKDNLTDYKTPKGTILFPLDKFTIICFNNKQ
ncbi:MAG: iron chaperone [Oscillospiraceae bacterium]